MTSRTAIVCAATKDLSRSEVNADAKTTICVDCGAEVWIAPSSLKVIERDPAVEAICNDCMIVTPTTVISAAPDASPEFRAAVRRKYGRRVN